MSRNLLNAVVQRRQPVLASNSPKIGHLGTELSISPAVMQITAIAVPLTLSERQTAPSEIDLLYAVPPPMTKQCYWSDES